MKTHTWSLQDAKNKFSEVIKAANNGRPQIVTRRGIPSAVVLSIEEFDHYKKLSELSLPSFTDHLLNMPTDGSEFERLDVTPRDFL